MKKLLQTSVLILIVFNLSAQNRIEKPFQIHVNGSGLFLKTFGNALADSEITDLDVKKWAIPGISIGYHLNQRFFFAYNFQPNLNLILKEPWTFGDMETDGNITLNHNTANFHSIEGRYFPFKMGLYGSLFFSQSTKAKYKMNFNRTNQEMVIGENSYQTDLVSEWNFKPLSTIGFGLGYNYVHKSGFSFDLGFGIPIPFQDPLYRNITINSINGTHISQEDKELAKTKIENELFYFPVQLHLNFGYNFELNSKDG